MASDLKAKYLKTLIKMGRGRVARGLELLAAGDDANAAGVENELHSLAGEASMLGFTELGEVARQGEHAARDWKDNGNKRGMIGAMRALRTLSKQLDQLAAEGDAPPAEAPPAAAPAEPQGPLRVLVVDDSPINASVLTDALEDEGYEARAAETMDEVLGFMADFRPGLVLTDVNMPDLSLDALCDAIRGHTHGGGARIYLVSGMPADVLAVRAREVGAQGYVSKDEGLDSIVDQVHAIAGRRSS
jgi:CheY-like chemotaxis protein